MDLYSSDLRLSDIGLDPEERENFAREYPLGMLDEEEEDSSLFNPYSPGSSTGYEDSGNDILSDVAMNSQVITHVGGGTLMEIEEGTAGHEVDVMLDVLNTTDTTNLHWIDSFLQDATCCPTGGTLIDDDILVSPAIMRKNPRVKSEHSYSLANTPTTSSTCSSVIVDLNGGLKVEHDDDDDDTCDGLEHDEVDVETDETGLLFGSLVEEGDVEGAPMKVLIETIPGGNSRAATCRQSVTVRCVTSLDDLYDVKPDATELGHGDLDLTNQGVGFVEDGYMEYDVKVEPDDNNELCNSAATMQKSMRLSTNHSAKSDLYSTSIMLQLPPTPPPSSGSSSNSNSDSESCLSPSRSPSASPTQPLTNNTFSTKQLSVRHNENLWTATIHQSSAGLASSNSSGFNSSTSGANQILQSGMMSTLYLTEEEKRTMLSEGYPLPTKLPLTKQEEKNLKKIRRKIKNKISAQESRRKKKEYLESLEKKVETVSQENNHLKKKVDILETNNRSLVSQLQRLQGLVNKLTPTVTQATATTTCVLVN